MEEKHTCKRCGSEDTRTIKWQFDGEDLITVKCHECGSEETRVAPW